MKVTILLILLFHSHTASKQRPKRVVLVGTDERCVRACMRIMMGREGGLVYLECLMRFLPPFPLIAHRSYPFLVKGGEDVRGG